MGRIHHSYTDIIPLEIRERKSNLKKISVSFLDLLPKSFRLSDDGLVDSTLLRLLCKVPK